MLDLENYSSSKNRMRRQMKKKKSAIREIGTIKELGKINPIFWNTRNKEVLFDGMKIGTASNSRQAQKIAKEHAKKNGLSFFSC